MCLLTLINLRLMKTVTDDFRSDPPLPSYAYRTFFFIQNLMKRTFTAALLFQHFNQIMVQAYFILMNNRLRFQCS